MAKRALVTGITGQDGSYLAGFLLGKEELPLRWHVDEVKGVRH